MKGLKQFLNFDWQNFSKDKQFLVVGTGDYVEFGTNNKLGSKIDTVIVKDTTNYSYKDKEKDKDKPFTNLYEKLSFKVTKDIDVPLNSIIVPEGEIKATVWGDYSNNLSVICSDIKIVEPTKASSQGNSKILPNLN